MYPEKTGCSITEDDFSVLSDNDGAINSGVYDEMHVQVLENLTQQTGKTDTGLKLHGLLKLFEPLFPHQ